LTDIREIVDAFERILGERLAKPISSRVKYPEARKVDEEEIRKLVEWLREALLNPEGAEEGLRRILGWSDA